MQRVEISRSVHIEPAGRFGHAQAGPFRSTASLMVHAARAPVDPQKQLWIETAACDSPITTVGNRAQHHVGRLQGREDGGHRLERYVRTICAQEHHRAALKPLPNSSEALAQIPGALMNPHLFLKFVLNNRIGNLIFYPGHPGDLLFSPYLSPILGGYYQLASAITGLLTGQSLNYTISSGVERKIVASLASYDLVDTWWANAVRTGLLGSTATAGILLIVIALLAVSVFSAWTLIQSARPSGQPRAEHPAGAIQ